MLTTDRLCMGCMNDNGGEEVCPICGFNSSTKNPSEFLPVKTWIKDRYLLGKVIESDGEGVTYIGWDNDLDNIVNIREFFPTAIASRGDRASVVINEGHEYDFNAALMDFLNLHNALSGVSLAAVAPVIEIIECNNSAYVVTKGAAGVPLREFLLRNGGTLSFEQARPLFMPMISQLVALHQNGIIHGGISPETILVGRDGKLRLTGFAGASLRTVGSPLNAQLFPGYAAIEQYAEGGGTLSETSDVYSFAATLFRVLMGSTLPEAKERVTDDKMSVPAKIAQALPKAVLVALADALQIMPENRTQTMKAFKVDIAPAADATSGFVAAVDKATPKKGEGKKTPKAKKRGNKHYALMSAGITAGIFLIVVLVLWLTLANPFAGNKTPTESSTPISSSSSESQPIIQSGEKLLAVPDFSAMNVTFEQICQSNADFKFQVLGKKYSSKAAGLVVGQDVPAGSKVARDTTIYLTVSLGPETINLPELKGKTKDAALIELFKQGFLYKNIQFYEIEDDSVDYNCVAKTDPVADSTITPDSTITVYLSNVKGNNASETE